MLPDLQQEDVETQLLEGVPPLGINGLQPVFLKIFPLVLVIHLCHICQRISPVKAGKNPPAGQSWPRNQSSQ